MKLVIINYGAGNIQSIMFAFQRLGLETVLSDDAEEIRAADRIIFPGVGEASSAMKKLRHSGLDRIIPDLRQPVLGICLGMQLMCRFSEEGQTEGLGIFDIDVLRFNHGVKVPQIGWNQIKDLQSGLFNGVKEDAYIYLVHSYYAPLSEDTLAKSDYGLTYSTALGRDNFYGVQFHPEKSSKVGERILKNFLVIKTTMEEVTRIGTEIADMDLEMVHRYLSNESYWARGRTQAEVRRSMENSLCFALFHGEMQIGFARVVTDFVVFSWLMDFFILKEFRGKGFGKELLAHIMSLPELREVKGMGLRTTDAHNFYKEFGFSDIPDSGSWMYKNNI